MVWSHNWRGCLLPIGHSQLNSFMPSTHTWYSAHAESTQSWMLMSHRSPVNPRAQAHVKSRDGGLVLQVPPFRQGVNEHASYTYKSKYTYIHTNLSSLEFIVWSIIVHSSLIIFSHSFYNVEYFGILHYWTHQCYHHEKSQTFLVNKLSQPSTISEWSAYQFTVFAHPVNATFAVVIIDEILTGCRVATWVWIAVINVNFTIHACNIVKWKTVENLLLQF